MRNKRFQIDNLKRISKEREIQERNEKSMKETKLKELESGKFVIDSKGREIRKPEE